jgi:hypothetical protein
MVKSHKTGQTDGLEFVYRKPDFRDVAQWDPGRLENRSPREMMDATVAFFSGHMLNIELQK